MPLSNSRVAAEINDPTIKTDIQDLPQFLAQYIYICHGFLLDSREKIFNYLRYTVKSVWMGAAVCWAAPPRKAGNIVVQIRVSL